jgi:hypothetical protein
VFKNDERWKRIDKMFGMRIDKYNKVMEAIKKNIRAGPQTSLNIKSSGVVVLRPIGRNDRHNDLPNGQA